MELKKDRVLVTGANGFTGRFVCKELIKNNIKFIALLRPGNNPSWMISNKIDYIFADLDDFQELNKIFKRFKILINIASLGFGSAPKILKASEEGSIKRAIFISTTGIFTRLNPSSKKIRIDAEKMIQKSNLDWTIIRPTMIYGNYGDRNIIKIIKFIYKFPIIPIFGGGKALLQPLNVEDLAKTLISIIDNKSTYHEIYNLSGANTISFICLVQLIAKIFNKRIITINLPAFFFINLFRFLEKFNLRLSIKSEQIERLLENKNFSNQKARDTFNYSPISIEEGIEKEINSFLKLK